MSKATKQARMSTIGSRLDVLEGHTDLYAGIDLHRDVMQIEVQTEEGTVLFNGAFSTDIGGVREVLKVFQGRVKKMACEATGFWYWFSDLCREMDLDLVLANPHQLRVIAASVKKCDRLDAHWLCEFLRQGYIDEAAAPEQAARDRRELFRTRELLKRHAQDMKRQIRSFLNQYNVRTAARDPFCAKGRRELRSLELRPLVRKSLDYRLNVLEALLTQMAALEPELEKMAEQELPAQLLQQEVPGIGPILATAILTEAMDISRFGSARQFAAHTGLVPRVRASAGKQTRGGITKHGPRYLRWALVQAARQMVANDPVVKKWYTRHRRRKGAGRAYVMVAHKLARYLYLFAVHGVCFESAKLFPPRRKKKRTA